MFTSSLATLTLGDFYPRLRAFRPSRASSRGVVKVGRGRHPRVWFAAAPPGGPRSNPPATKGWPWSGHHGTRKREKPVARWTGAFLLLASALARHTPSLLGGWEKRRANPKPDQNWGRCSLRCLTIEYV